MSFYSRFSTSALTKVVKAVSTTVKPSINISSASFLRSLQTVYQTKAAAPATVTAVRPQVAVVKPSLAKDYRLNVPNLLQGKNECGPTSLAMALQYNGVGSNQHTMFSSSTVGHGPVALKEIAEAKGLRVRQQNNGTLEDLAQIVDSGMPALVLGIYGGGTNSSLSQYINNAGRAHWMVVTGYKRDANGQITNIYFNNPNQSTPQCWSAADFKAKFWDNNIIPGGHNYYMAMAKKGSYQETALIKKLPNDKMTDTFRYTLQAIDQMEDTFYTTEKTANTIANTAKVAVSTVESTANTVASTATKAWNSIFG